MKYKYILILASILILSCGKDQKNMDSIFSTNIIKSQFFKINVNFDTTLITDGQVIVEIEKNTFKSNGSSELVELEIKEILTKRDIVTSGLNTLSNEGNILESGGMIFLDVQPEQDKEFEKEIRLKIPTSAINLDMGQFMLSDFEEKGKRWKKEKDIIASSITNRIRSGREDYINNCTSCHSKNLRADLTGPALGNIHLFRTKEWFVEFTKNSQLMIVNEDSLALCLWNSWKPSLMNSFEGILTDEEISDIYMFLANESIIQSIDTNEVEYILGCKTEIRGDPDDPNDNYEHEYIEKTNQEIKRRIILKNPWDNLTTGLNYELRTNKIGWRNLDCFLNPDSIETKKVEPFKMYVECPEENENETVLIIFKERNVVIPAYSDGIIYKASWNENVLLPEEEVYLVGVSEGEKYWFGYKEIKIGEKNSYVLELKESTRKEIRSFINNL